MDNSDIVVDPTTGQPFAPGTVPNPDNRPLDPSTGLPLRGDLEDTEVSPWVGNHSVNDVDDNDPEAVEKRKTQREQQGRDAMLGLEDELDSKEAQVTERDRGQFPDEEPRKPISDVNADGEVVTETEGEFRTKEQDEKADKKEAKKNA